MRGSPSDFASALPTTFAAIAAPLAPHDCWRGTVRSWWCDAKASDDLLDPVFESFFAQLDLPNLMRKTDYHRLAELVSAAELDAEIGRVLDRILTVAQAARPAGAPDPTPA
ncbi:MAG: hypothetical protein RLZZ117_548 [Cyanobacteriota bacterium]